MPKREPHPVIVALTKLRQIGITKEEAEQARDILAGSDFSDEAAAVELELSPHGVELVRAYIAAICADAAKWLPDDDPIGPPLSKAELLGTTRLRPA